MSRSSESALLPIGELAALTGVAVATLRAWETRFGFPAPVRTESGHRRYTGQHVDQVARVVAARAAGLSLEAAISSVRDRTADGSISLFAELRRQHPTLAVQRLTRRAMLALSTAIEDEACARGDRPLLFGCFQKEQHYRTRAARWKELARTAELTVVFAEFTRARRGAATPIEVNLPPSIPLSREWAVVSVGRRHLACLVGWETPDRRSGQRMFEAVCSVRPEVVATAARIALDVAAVHGAGRVPELAADALAPGRDPAESAQDADSLLVRVLAELDR